ncbi:hypothetical protein SNE35_31365 [Paucibacter sp. R3-3]|uniref:Uncharacterized protein n=1 Tax=Roseateles agri TaxID=3098619 RepID=A0ABU5DRU7_9BURK|nr:hypothetical protein [Paucibacter sp. R3-3]MDY0749038.1 hypothetical protein [Paucibacter sp. R3-3]
MNVSFLQGADCMPLIAEPTGQVLELTGRLLRPGRLLMLDECSTESTTESCRRPFLELPVGLQSLECLVILGPTHSIANGGSGLSLTYVHRHSPAGLHWRNSDGVAVDLQPGALFISQTRRDVLLELSPSEFGESCDYVQWLLNTTTSAEIAACVRDEDVAFWNSPEACVRVLVGEHELQGGAHVSLPPMNLFDIDLAPLAEFDLLLEEDREVIALVSTGSLQLHGVQIDAPCALAFLGNGPLVRLSTRTGASVLWLEWSRSDDKAETPVQPS